MKAVRLNRAAKKKGEHMKKEAKLSTKILAGVLAGLMIISVMTTAIMLIVENFAH